MTQSPTLPSTRLVLWSLLFGNFLIGTGVLLPAGLLNDMAGDFDISASKAGQLSLIGGLVVGVGAPVFASLTSRIDRRLLLTLSLLLYGLGHLAASLAATFDQQLWLRAITIVGAAIFTPQAAATAGLLLPPERRAAAIAFIFIGWSAANVVGIPLGGYLSAHYGWRLVYGLMAVFSLAGSAAVWFTLRKGLFVQPLGLAAWGKALGTPVLLVVFLVTLLSFSGQFIMFAYIAPMLRDGFAASPALISMAFLTVGIAGVSGNFLASRLVSSYGVDQVIAAGLASLCLGFVFFALVYGNFGLALVASLFWGLGSFSSNSLQQSRLAGLAPPIASATIALNTSFVYLGQAIGAHMGGHLIDRGAMSSLPWMAFGFLAAALATSFMASRLSPKT